MLNAIGYEGPISIEWEDAGMDRLTAHRKRWTSSAVCCSNRPTTSFDAAFSTKGG